MHGQTVVQALALLTLARQLLLKHRALLLSVIAIGADASTKIDRPSPEKWSGYTLDYNTPNFLSQVPICHINASLENLPFNVHGHVIVNYINFDELLCNYKIIFTKIYFHL